MIIVHLAGGLGNQMFQYAYGRANAQRLGVELTLELSDKTLQIHNGFELERIFNIRAREASQQDVREVLGWQRHVLFRNLATRLPWGKTLLPDYIQESHFNYAPRLHDIPDNKYVRGYWQSEKYFSEFASTIRSDFTFRQPLSSQNTAIAEKIRGLNAVSLHVRRNDYAKNAKVNATHGLCSLDYYRAAVTHISERVEQPHFFVFSDDMPWVMDNLNIGHPCEYVTHNLGAESYNDMRLMCICKHHIIANSSFSWWGAWLNSGVNKIVVAPRQWFAKETDASDIYPVAWERL